MVAGSLRPAMSSSGLELVSLEAGRHLTPGPGVLISSVEFILHFHELPFLPHRTTLFFRLFPCVGLSFCVKRFVNELHNVKRAFPVSVTWTRRGSGELEPFHLPRLVEILLAESFDGGIHAEATESLLDLACPLFSQYNFNFRTTLRRGEMVGENGDGQRFGPRRSFQFAGCEYCTAHSSSTTESAPQGHPLCADRNNRFRRQCDTNRLQIGNWGDWRLRLSSSAYG